MRVSCTSIAEFIENLRTIEDPSGVFCRVVYWSVNRQPLDGDRRTACRFSVVVQASTIINVDDGQYLLEAGEDCGRDLEMAGGDRAGSDRAEQARLELLGVCETRGLVVRPGVCSE